jgi:hypothetical protein
VAWPPTTLPTNPGEKLAETHVLHKTRSLTNRSRISNGKDLFLEGVDGRSALARRFRDILAQLVSDSGGRPLGGSKHHCPPSNHVSGVVRAGRAKATAGETLSIGEYATATNTLRRLLLDLGLERRMRDITPSIDAYLSKGPRIKRKPGRREAGRAYTVTRVNMAQPRAALGGVERCRGV